MQTKDAIRTVMNSSNHIVSAYLADLSDADLLVRPVPGANTIAWQLGHIISSEQRLLSKVPGAQLPELPAGFAEAHGKDRTTAEGPQGFRTKQEYLDLARRVRAATLAALEKVPDSALDQQTGIEYAPTVGALFLMIGNHPLMHAGQFAVVRRKLGKPIAI